MKKLFNFLVLLFICNTLSSQNSMTVLDPQRWWSDEAASVENLEFTIRPVGTYAEVEMAFDVKAAGGFNSGTGIPLEFVMQFRMDKDIVFNDSWLWIGSYISKGEIYEANEGTQIYEDIVDRRQDPSILTKHSPESYSLRIYPLDPDSTRRVKLTYLTPLDFENREAVVELPLYIFNSSFEVPTQATLAIEDSFDWEHYEPSSDIFSLIESNSLHEKYFINDFEAAYDTKINFMPTNAAKDYFIGTYSEGSVNYYQLAYFPELELVQPSTYNMVVVDFDKDHTNQNITQVDVLNLIEEELRDNLSPNDYFNICYSDFITTFVSDDWVLATNENVSNAVQTVRDTWMEDSPKLTVLIPEALNFINDNNKNSKLHIISSSVTYAYANTANRFLEDINDYIKSMTSQVNIFALDYANLSRPHFWLNGFLYTGNEYFFELLCANNNGEYFSVHFNDPLNSSLEKMLSLINLNIADYNFDLDFTDGFSYSNYINTNNNATININEPILSTGKYVGEFPVTLEFQGIIDGAIFDNQIVIEKEDVIPLNSLSKNIWQSNYLLHNEYNPDNVVTNNVIELSKEERLLCAKTIFLCLEPDTTAISSESVDGENDDDILISTTETELADEVVSVYPNPFAESITFRIPVRDDLDNGNLLIEIMDATGKIIYQEEVQSRKEGDFFIIEWNRTDKLMSGMYIFKLSNKHFVANKKVIFIGH